MSILILGKNGMLGQNLQKFFDKGDCIAWDRNDLDITKEKEVFEKLIAVQPDLVFNTTGYTKVDLAEKEEEVANQINGYAVGILARACRKIGATLIHFSTDYVFEGSNEKGYTEDAQMLPLNAYGRSKMLGEILLKEEMELEDESDVLPEGKYFIIRTSWLFGEDQKSFNQRILSKALKGDTLKVVQDQYGRPTFILDLCQQTKWLIESNEYPSGIYHITNSGNTNWYEFAKAILKYKKLDHLVAPCASDEFPTAAKRPQNSILLNTKLPELRSW